MKAMIFAAGLGTRLQPLTHQRPKALVELNGRTLLEITLRRLRDFGVREVIVNVHHRADMIVEYLKTNHFNMRIEVSREEVLLDTGGGLKQAAHFFLEGPSSSQSPFFVHNVDVISTIDLDRMLRFHVEKRALATLAVQKRKASRYLLLDHQQQLCGRQTGRDHDLELVRPFEQVRQLAFCGIHVVSPRLLSLIEEEGAFSIIDVYLRLAAHQQRILGFGADDYNWRDVGSLASLGQAVRGLTENSKNQREASPKKRS